MRPKAIVPVIVSVAEIVVSIIMALAMLWLISIAFGWNYIFGYPKSVTLWTNIFFYVCVVAIIYMWCFRPLPIATALLVFFTLTAPTAGILFAQSVMQVGGLRDAPVWSNIRSALITALLAWITTMFIRYTRESMRHRRASPPD